MRRSESDLRVAKLLLHSNEPEAVLFHCQQAIEKAPKAIWSERREDDPAKTHSLPGLFAVLEQSLNAEQQEFLRGLDALYVRTRYPDEPLGADLDIPNYVDRVENLWLWLRQQTT